ncbi:hypothetical protein NY054_09070 [Corynebacterium diphtheriae bv. mitis]|nr:hypothetical protein NY054_09070 [Corynebacterium diphtheriae bv. mitis]
MTRRLVAVAGGELSEVVDVRDDAVAVGVDTQWLVDFCAGEVLEFPRRGGVAEGGYAMPADDEFRGGGRWCGCGRCGRLLGCPR